MLQAVIKPEPFSANQLESGFMLRLADGSAGGLMMKRGQDGAVLLSVSKAQKTRFAERLA